MSKKLEQCVSSPSIRPRVYIWIYIYIESHNVPYIEVLQSEPLPSNGIQLQERQGYQWPNTTSVDQGYFPFYRNYTLGYKLLSKFLLYEVEHFKNPAFPSAAEVETSAYYKMLLDQSAPPEAPIKILPVPQIQRYTIQDISPPWGYNSDTTKVGRTNFILSTKKLQGS